MMAQLSEDQRSKRLALYNAGKSDYEIARIEGIDRTTVRQWRKLRKLPTHRPAKQPAEFDRRRCRELYDAGLNDSEIGRQEGVPRQAISHWRTKQRLPPHCPLGCTDQRLRWIAPPENEKMRVAKALLRKGVGARLLSRELAMAIKTLEKWRTSLLKVDPHLRREGSGPRRSPRHPTGRPYSRLVPEKRVQAFALYAADKCDAEIAAALDLRRQQVWEWRHAFFLPAHARPSQAKPTRKLRHSSAAITPYSNPLYAHIAAAIGRTLAPDMRDDAISELLLSIQEGEIDIAAIDAVARQFRGKVLKQYAPKDTRSLDEQIGSDGDGFTLLDTLVDDSASSWLEEMGATVW